MSAPITLVQIDPDTLARIEERLARIEAALSPPPAEWLSITEAAAAWRVSEATVRRRIRDGQVQVKGHGKLKRVRA